MEREEANMSQMLLSRRSFVTSGAACAGAALIDPRTSVKGLFKTPNGVPEQTVIQATTRSIEINGKAATMMGLQQSDGKHGLSLTVNQAFDVLLENKLTVPTAIHWHGLHPPNNQDGVPGLTQPVIAPGASARYNFRTIPSGTHWMHSHEGLQEAFLLAAPLIVHDPADEPTDEQQIVLFLGDFSFTPPREILDRLQHPAAKPMSMNMNKPDANDVDYDAYLANDRTLADPEVVRVEKNARVRLRIINGSSGTNFFINLGDLQGEVIATDGMAVKPLKGSRFPLAIAQRIDVRLQLPHDGAFPILALRENATEQTGLILATPGATIKKLALQTSSPAGLLDLGMERQFEAIHPLATKPIDRTFELRLAGNMAKYEWPINGVVFDVANPRTQKPAIVVKSGQRAAIKFINETRMSHPMHLHGHSFQVIDINGNPLRGALRDTLLVPPKSNVTVAFDADNPGTWYLHCHILWHLAAGMAVLVQYE
jgi:FtsP/CotA-like multicopper oxidase with cupredoxin domain